MTADLTPLVLRLATKVVMIVVASASKIAVMAEMNEVVLRAECRDSCEDGCNKGRAVGPDNI